MEGEGHFGMHLIENIECLFGIVFGVLIILMYYFSIEIPSAVLIISIIGAIVVILGLKDITTIIADEHHVAWKVFGILGNLHGFFVAAIFFSIAYGLALPIPEFSDFINYLVLPGILIAQDIFWIGLNWFSGD